MAENNALIPGYNRESEQRAYNPRTRLIVMDGNKLYLPVAGRVEWFRSEQPDGRIVTGLDIDRAQKTAVATARVFRRVTGGSSVLRPGRRARRQRTRPEPRTRSARTISNARKRLRSAGRSTMPVTAHRPRSAVLMPPAWFRYCRIPASSRCRTSRSLRRRSPGQCLPQSLRRWRTRARLATTAGWRSGIS